MPGGRLNCRTGFLRLGVSLMLLWFVFWTFAYVLKPRSAENSPSPPAFSLSSDLALLATVMLVVPWIVGGFRAD